MKQFKNILYVSLVLFGFLLISCSDDDSSPTTPTATFKFTCTLNGGGWNNETISFTTGAGSIYSPDENLTSINFSGTGNSDAGAIKFAGNKTGTFAIENDSNDVAVSITGRESLELETGTITVTYYGGVGGEVKGTFSGTSINSSTNTTVQVTNGSFSGKRVL